MPSSRPRWRRRGRRLQFVELLDGEGEMLAHIIGRDAGLTFGAERHVQQGACGGDATLAVTCFSASTRPRLTA